MVMVVNDKSRVEARNVVAAQAIGDKWLISEGLKPGDKVIVSGLQKARPGVGESHYRCSCSENGAIR